MKAVKREKLSFGDANAKLEKGANGRRMATFSLPAGWTCPFAVDCKSKAHPEDGKIEDGKKTKFRCFAASMEARATNIRNSRHRNWEMLQAAKTAENMADLIAYSLPKKAEIVRVHVSGDFYHIDYMRAWFMVARMFPDKLFYAYTKSIGYWVELMNEVPANFKLNASKGGSRDSLIGLHGLKHVEVIFHPEEAAWLGLSIDHDDTHAYDGNESFALVLHGTQPKGTKAAAALKRLRKEGIAAEYSYS